MQQTKPLTMSAEGAMRLRNFELDEEISKSTALVLVDDLAEAALSLIDSLIEHWTDDEGLHIRPFEKALREQLPREMRAIAERELSS